MFIPTPRATRRAAVAAALAAGVVLAAGCSSTPSAEQTADDGEVTLRLAFSSLPDMVDALADAFHEEHPEITIVPEHTAFADYVTSIRLSMSSDTAPDIAQFAVPTKDLVAAGEQLALDDAAEEHGWYDSFPVSALEQLELSDDGRKFGTGSLYGVPVALSMTGVFYNKQIAAEIGMTEPPATIEEFEALLADAKAAGKTPIMMGALDYGANHVWGSIINSYLPAQDYRDWVNGADGGDITGKQGLAATTTFADWAEKGYFNDGTNGIGAADASAAFGAGDGLFFIGGNWVTGALEETMGDDVGYFLFPQAEKDKSAVTGGSSVAYTVSARTEHPEEVATFLDWLRTPEAGEIVVANGYLPVASEALADVTGLAADVSEAYAQISEGDGVNLFSDWAATDALATLTPGVQGMIAGEVEPAAFLESIQEVRDAYHAE